MYMFRCCLYDTEVLTTKSETWWKDGLKSTADKVCPHIRKQVEAIPGSHIVLEINPMQIHMVSTTNLKIAAPPRVIENYEKRKIPRFR